MGGMMVGPLATFRPYEPVALLEQADRLGLDDGQVARLTALRDSTEQRLEAAHAPAQAAMQGVRRALEAEAPDTAAVRRLLSAHMIAMGNMQWARLEAALNARQVLTHAQRTIIGEMTSDTPAGMQQRHRGGRGR
jgi:Spy/CpxP family protein refolding chaperone